MAEVLETAAEHVRAGWTQNLLFDKVDGVQYCCGSGAIWLACGMDASVAVTRDWSVPRELWYNTYRKLSEFVGDELPAWNDALGRTQAEVVDAMLHLAKELRNEPS